MIAIAITIAETCTQMKENFKGETARLLQQLYSQTTLQPITFTAYGFFVINLELFSSIMIGTLSYLIILIQFSAS